MEKSPKTIALYKKHLDELQTEFDSSGMNFLKNTKDVIAYIEGLSKSYASKKLYYAVLVSTLRDMKSKTKLLREAEDTYRAKMMEYNSKLAEQAQEQIMSPREEKIWLNWEEILEAYKRLEAANLNSKNIYRDYVILSLYILLPPTRADWSPVRIVCPEDLAPSGNQMVVADKITFVLSEYKTSKTHGVQRIELPTGLEAIIRHWLTLETSGWLFSNGDAPATESWLSHRVRAIFKRLTGKAVGINILRHSYISWVRQGEIPIIQQQAMAKAMCHSVSQSVLYRRLGS